ncbi:DUF1993 domain-containing protein [Citromicrobium bathyomarinum]|uniref:DUF1993 domain-containing protein n=1 Tax=Citromicrobium bathyomarinum TaxID=72174 RepID=UPI00315AA247
MTADEILAPTYVQMLGALSQWLDKAAQQLGGTEADALLAARLAPDMFPLSTQIRFACVQALEGMHRLRDEAFPPVVEELLDEGRDAGDAPGSMADAQARLEQTTAMVRSLAEDLSTGDPERMIAHELPMGMIFDLSVEQYARDWALAQFYFHLMTAYAILRSEGVALGKADYVTHMFGYLRPGTMPARTE